jgi:hypothetical protein
MQSRPGVPPVATGPGPPGGEASHRGRDGGRRVLAGGVVAHNEEGRIGAALASLLDQQLPPGWTWGTVWVVASGCTDRTVEIVEDWARRDLRVKVVVEPERRGKARALGEVLRRSSGDALVLLNSDARAGTGAVASLLATAAEGPAPYAVMARPVPEVLGEGAVLGMIRLLWDVHDQFHRELLSRGESNHVSDELLLLSLPTAPPIPDGVINDGSYFGAWLTSHGGRLSYAPDAVVSTEAPTTLRGHLTQRRRILVGHRQVEELFGVAPVAMPRYALAHPRAAVAILLRALRQGEHRVTYLLLLFLAERAASALAVWDRLPPRRDHVRWERVPSVAVAGHGPVLSRGMAGETGAPRPVVSAGRPLLDDRVEALLGVARRFGTGVPLEELRLLLPLEGPGDPVELERWLYSRPDLARIEGDRAYSPGGLAHRTSDRERRADQYRAAAERLVGRDLRPLLPLLRCVAITGSTAYGAPEEGDDLDLFVVTRSGTLWVVLAYTYLAVRLRFQPAVSEGRPPPCLNYVLDERRAPAEFWEARDFLFAREALSARVLRGEEYYRDLLACAPWLGTEIPRLYAQRSSGTPPRAGNPAPRAIRVLNAALYPWLAAYLQFVGLWRNHASRARNGTDGTFRTVTGARRLAFVSARFDRLRADLAAATHRGARQDRPVGAPARSPSSR